MQHPQISLQEDQGGRAPQQFGDRELAGFVGSELLFLPGLAKMVGEVSGELVLQHIAYQFLAVALAQLLSS